MVRFTVHFCGQVQGVGFRYTTAQIACQHSVSGYVRNLPDGRVLLVAEGERDQTKAFVNEVVTTMDAFINDCSTDESTATGEFGTPGTDRFSIRY